MGSPVLITASGEGVTPVTPSLRVDHVELSNGSDVPTLVQALKGRRVVVYGSIAQKWMETDHFPSYDWRFDPRGFIVANSPWNDNGYFLKKSTRPCIHLEGTDGSGKSTLGNYLSEELNLPFVPSMGPQKTPEEADLFSRGRLVPGSIYDRSAATISEFVYGTVCRDGNFLLKDLGMRLSSQARAITWVYCRPSFEFVQKSHKPEPGEDPGHLARVEAGMRELYDMYDNVMLDLEKAGAAVIWYDLERDDREQLKRRLACVA